MRVRIVSLKGEVVKREVEDVVHSGVQVHPWKVSGSAFNLQAGLVQMVEVEMGIAKCVDELRWLQGTHLRDHQRQQGIRRNIKGDPKKNVCTSLVKLAGERSIGHIELKNDVARWQGHFIKLAHVPGTDDVAAGMRGALDLIYKPGDLVVTCSIGSLPRAPLVAVDRPQVPIFISPIIPDPYVIFVQVSDVRVTCQEPEQLVDD